MLLALDADGGASLDDADDCTSFSIAGIRPVRPAALARARDRGIDLSEDGTHGYVAPSTVVQLADGLTGDGWAGRFEEMIAYAAGKGWLDARGHIRAHTTWATEPGPGSGR